MDNQLGMPFALDILRQIDQQLQHNELQSREIVRIIEHLRKAASQNLHETSMCPLSTLMKTLLRIDQLAKYQKLEKDKVNTFNERLAHL